jgi:hypothetical protein
MPSGHVIHRLAEGLAVVRELVQREGLQERRVAIQIVDLFVVLFGKCSCELPVALAEGTNKAAVRIHP